MNFLVTLRHALLRALMPLTKEVGLISWPVGQREMVPKIHEFPYDKMAEGDVLLSRCRGHLSNLLIGGFYKHAAIIVRGKHEELGVVEAVGAGVRFCPLLEWLIEKDIVLVLSSKFANPLLCDLAASNALKLIGSPYDYFFEYSPSNDRAFYCSEVIWYAYDQAFAKNGQKSPFTPRETLGVMTITPDDYANAKEKWAVKWDSKAVA